MSGSAYGTTIPLTRRQRAGWLDVSPAIWPVDLLIGVVHKIGVRAEHTVDRALLAEVKRVPGKTNILVRVAEASLEHPDDIVRDVVFGAAGGEQRLRDVVHEYKASGHGYQTRVHTIMRRSYSHHYRRMVPALLQTLRFRSSNVVHQPVCHEGHRRLYPACSCRQSRRI